MLTDEQLCENLISTWPSSFEFVEVCRTKVTMVLTLYYDLLSQPSRAIYIFLKLNNIPFVEKKISLLAGQQKTEEYREINPFQKVPVLDHDGFKLTERF